MAFLPPLSPLPHLAALFPLPVTGGSPPPPLEPLLLPLLPPAGKTSSAAAVESNMEEFLSSRCGLHDVAHIREKDGSSIFMASASSWEQWESARDLIQLCTCSQYSRKRHCYARDRSGVSLYYSCHCGGEPRWNDTAAKKRPGAAGVSKKVGCTASLLAVVSTSYALKLGLTTTPPSLTDHLSSRYLG